LTVVVAAPVLFVQFDRVQPDFLVFDSVHDIEGFSQLAQPVFAFLERYDALEVFFVELDFHGVVHVDRLLQYLYPHAVDFNVVGLLFADRATPPPDVGVFLGDGPGFQAEAVDVFTLHAPHRSLDQAHADRVFQRKAQSLVHELYFACASVQFLEPVLTLDHRGLAQFVVLDLLREFGGRFVVDQLDYAHLDFVVVVDRHVHVVLRRLDVVGDVEGVVFAFARRGVFRGLVEGFEHLGVDFDHAVLGVIEFLVGAYFEHPKVDADGFVFLHAVFELVFDDETFLAAHLERSEQEFLGRVQRVDFVELAVDTQTILRRHWLIILHQVLLETNIMNFTRTLEAIYQFHRFSVITFSTIT